MLQADELRTKIDSLPKVGLAAHPTPLHPVVPFSGVVGAEVWIKRDDLTGFALGGNKARKIEIPAPDARAQGADTLLTVGGGQSNHARTVAAAASAAGMRCHLVSVAKTAGELSLEVGLLAADVLSILGAQSDDAPGEILEGYMGPAYGEPTEGSRAALELLLRMEGIPTDPVYSAKALHGLVERARDLGGPIVFWHTGGVPALFSDEQQLMRWDAFSSPD
jgi:1-aminocyclopropane-1-carboxylate deaminase/D-cysteine desulfhydrase-like pyridoxal-dependent ACC family enzyme